MNTDPIADMLTRLRNAYMAKHSELEVPHSELKYSILKILEKNKYITGVKTEEEGHVKTIKVTLNEMSGNDGMQITFKKVSKPGRRVYVSAKEIKPVHNGFGIGVISTSRGVMTSYEAFKAGVGGEYICEVY